MIRDLTFQVSELLEYINWSYFYHTWGVKETNAVELKADADAKLQRWTDEGRTTRFRVGLFEANANDEDIFVEVSEVSEGFRISEGFRVSGGFKGVIPLLRQQVEPYLCLADFLPPTGMKPEKIGVFASTVPFAVEGLLEQTLADRLAEATAERGHELVRKEIWRYSPDEHFTPKELFAERYQGKRPAVGYPSLPDQSLNFVLSEMIDFPTLGITLTETGAMLPHASTSGLMLSHPKARHFTVGRISEEQLQDYAKRRSMSADTLRQFLQVQ